MGTNHHGDDVIVNKIKIRRNFILYIWTIIFIFFNYNFIINSNIVSAADGGDGVGSSSSGVLDYYIENSTKYYIVQQDDVLSNGGSGYYTTATAAAVAGDEQQQQNNNEKKLHKKEIKPKYGQWEVPGVNCTPPGIDDFPNDLFTPLQRQQGYLLIHFIISMYIFFSIALVCDDYFVPSMECICEELKMPSDVAGATFMAIATSAPELFTNIIGTFITKGDIGIGTIVGSAVFNILAVAAVCGLGAGMVVPLEWWSVTRDCLFYSLSVMLLIGVLRDERIYWYEASVLVLVYAFYILGMYKNTTLKKGAEKLVFKVERRLKKRSGGGGGRIETTYIPTAGTGGAPYDEHIDGNIKINGNIMKEENFVGPDEEEDVKNNDEKKVRDEMLVEEAVKATEAEAEEEKKIYGLCKLPIGYGPRIWIEWIFGWPIRAAYKFTIPDCRNTKWKRFFPLTFIMCIFWIGILSYIVNWMMTIIGHTLKIPDSVMGLTFIAAGTSIPEVVSSLIVSRQGMGTMAISNSIGSNTFDILMCLGLPWLIRSSIISQDEINYIKINSIGLEYAAIMLIASLAVLYIILTCNKYVLDRKVGILSLLLYIGFLIMASLFELNVFFIVNLPTCLHHED